MKITKTEIANSIFELFEKISTTNLDQFSKAVIPLATRNMLFLPLTRMYNHSSRSAITFINSLDGDTLSKIIPFRTSIDGIRFLGSAINRSMATKKMSAEQYEAVVRRLIEAHPDDNLGISSVIYIMNGGRNRDLIQLIFNNAPPQMLHQHLLDAFGPLEKECFLDFMRKIDSMDLLDIFFEKLVAFKVGYVDDSKFFFDCFFEYLNDVDKLPDFIRPVNNPFMAVSLLNKLSSINYEFCAAIKSIIDANELNFPPLPNHNLGYKSSLVYSIKPDVFKKYGTSAPIDYCIYHNLDNSEAAAVLQSESPSISTVESFNWHTIARILSLNVNKKGHELPYRILIDHCLDYFSKNDITKASVHCEGVEYIPQLLIWLKKDNNSEIIYGADSSNIISRFEELIDSMKKRHCLIQKRNEETTIKENGNKGKSSDSAKEADVNEAIEIFNSKLGFDESLPSRVKRPR